MGRRKLDRTVSVRLTPEEWAEVQARRAGGSRPEEIRPRIILFIADTSDVGAVLVVAGAAR